MSAPMKRMNWLTAGVSTAKMVVTTVADCCSTLSAGCAAAAADRVERLAHLVEQGQRLAHRLQLLLDEHADLGGAAEPVG